MSLGQPEGHATEVEVDAEVVFRAKFKGSARIDLKALHAQVHNAGFRQLTVCMYTYIFVCIQYTKILFSLPSSSIILRTNT